MIRIFNQDKKRNCDEKLIRDDDENGNKLNHENNGELTVRQLKVV